MDEFADALLMVKAGHPELAGWWGKVLGGGEKTFFTISPKQTGSGDPSPDNIRSILPGLTLTRDSGSTLTVYGGTLDVNTGVLTVDRAALSFSSGLNWTKSGLVLSGERSIFYNKGGIADCVPSSKVGSDHNEEGVVMQSSHYDIGQTSYYSLRETDESFAMGIGTSGGKADVGFLIEDRLTGGTVAGFKSWISGQSNAGTPVQVVYPLATPITYYLTQAEVQRAVAALKR